MGKNNYDKAPNYGYCASQGKHYYGYKLHSLCGLSGVIHSFDLTKASVHDIHYLKDVKCNFQNCTIIGDRGYIGAAIQLDLFVSHRPTPSAEHLHCRDAIVFSKFSMK